MSATQRGRGSRLKPNQTPVSTTKMQRTFGNSSSSSARLRFLLNGDATPPPPPPIAHPPPPPPMMVDKACQIELHLLGRVPDLIGDPSDHHDAVRECSTAREPRPPPPSGTPSRRNTPLRRTLELEEAIELFEDGVEPEPRTAAARRAQGLDAPDGVVKGEKVAMGTDRGVEEDGCGVRCLYVAVQCCECVIL